MAGWNGFTEQELSKLKSNEKEEATTTKATKLKTVPNKKLNKSRGTKVKTKEDSGDMMPQESTKNGTDVQELNEKQTIYEEKEEKNIVEKEKLTKDENTSDENDKNNIVIEKVIRVLTDSEAAEAQMSSLEKLQLQQKEIEEENKKKQSMIKETLVERMKQTQDESNKLKNINKELSKLDHLLQVDVTILRDRIDDACAEFSHAQKRFTEAEKEYVAAKMDFFKKKDHKDELQEHLYAIIQENEKRKARKLEQLLHKLNSTTDG